MPESNPRRGSARLRALLKNLHHQTWELELLISGLVAFALFQLPGPMARLQRVAGVQVGEASAIVVLLTVTFVKVALYLLLIAFGLHLVIRAFWVGLVGLDSVFPRGVRQDRVSGGPETKRLIRTLPSVRQLMVRTDALASVVFALAFSLVIVCVMAIPAYGIVLAAGSLVFALIPGRQDIQVVFWSVWTVFLLVSVVPALADRVVAPRLPPDHPLRRVIGGMLRAFQAVSGFRIYGPVQLTLGTHLGNRGVSAAIFVVILSLTGFFLVNDNILLEGRGVVLGSPFLPTQAGEAYLDRDHYDELRDPGRGRLDLPSLPAEVVTEPFVRLFIPYRPAAMDRDLRALCPGAEPVGSAGFRSVPTPRDDDETRAREARARRTLACAAALWRVELNGTPTEAPPVFARHPDTGIFGLRYMIPAAPLEVGRHTLVVERLAPREASLPPGETPPVSLAGGTDAGDAGSRGDEVDAERRFVILFWRGRLD